MPDIPEQVVPGIPEQIVPPQTTGVISTVWSLNDKISDSAPKTYYTAIKEKYYVGKESELEKSLDKHGIPRNFYEMDYLEFLTERRKSIAKIIKDHYELMN